MSINVFFCRPREYTIYICVFHRFLLPLDVLKIKSQTRPAVLAGRGVISIFQTGLLLSPICFFCQRFAFVVACFRGICIVFWLAMDHDEECTRLFRSVWRKLSGKEDDG